MLKHQEKWGLGCTRLMILILGMALVSAFLSGCSAIPETNPYRPVSLGNWNEGWSPREEPQPPCPDGPLTLQNALTLAIANNPDIGQATWNIQTARAQRDIAAGQRRWPLVSGVGAYTHFLDDQRLIPTSEPGETGTFTDDVVGRISSSACHCSLEGE